MDNVDERVVKLTLDNADFERKSQSTISVLQKLNESMNLQDNAKSVGKYQNAIDLISFSGIESSLDDISSKFGTLATIGRSVIFSLTNTAVNKIMSIGKALYNNTIGQIESGGMSRALNLEQAQFQLKGLGVDWKESKNGAKSLYEQIDKAVSGTAYGLDEAARVASQLIASSIKEGTDAMQNSLSGISGVAAMTNSGYSEIGQIFTTMAANGKVMTMQLRQLSSRGLNVAAELAKYYTKEKGETFTEEDIYNITGNRKGAKLDKISYEDFAEAMNKAFGKQATKANDTYSGSLANVRAALSRIGEAIQTPKMEAMRKIFVSLIGVLNALKKSLTPIFELTSKFMGKTSDRVVSFLNGLTKSVEHVNEETGKAGEGYLNTMDKITNALSNFAKFFTKTRKDGMTAIQRLQNAFESLVSLFTKVFKSIGSMFSMIHKGFKKTSDEADPLYDILRAITNGIVKMTDKMLKVISVINSVFVENNRLTDLVLRISNLFKGVFSEFSRGFKRATALVRPFSERLKFLSNILATLIDGIKVFINVLSAAFTRSSAVARVAAAIYSTLRTIGNILKSLIKIIIEIAVALTPIAEVALTIIGAFADAIKEVFDFVNSVNISAMLQTATKIIKSLLKTLGMALSVITNIFDIVWSLVTFVFPFLNSIGHGVGSVVNDVLIDISEVLGSILKVVDNLLGKINYVLTNFKRLASINPEFKRLKDTISDTFKSIFDIAINLKNALKTALSPITGLFQNLNPFDTDFEDGAQTVLGGVVDFLGKVAGKISDVLSGFNGGLETFNESVIELGQKIRDGLQSIIDDIPEKFESFKEKFINAFNAVKDKIKEIIDAIKGFFSDAIDSSPFITSIVSAAETAANKVKSIPSKIKNAVSSVTDRFGSSGTIVTDHSARVTSARPSSDTSTESTGDAASDLNAQNNRMVAVAEETGKTVSIIDKAKSAILKAINGFKKIKVKGIEVFTRNFSKATYADKNTFMEKARQFFINLKNFLSEVFGGIWNAIKTKVSDFLGSGSPAANVFNKVIEFFRNMFSTLWEKLGQAIAFVRDDSMTVREKFAKVFDSIKEFFANIWAKIKGIPGNVTKDGEEAKGSLNKVFDFIASVFRFIWDKMKTIAEAITHDAEGAKNTLGRAFEFIGGLFGNVWSGITGLFKNASAEGASLSTIFQNVKDFYKRLFSSVAKGFTTISKTTGETFGDTIIRFFSSITGIFRQIFTAITDSLQIINKDANTGSAMRSIGASIGQGFSVVGGVFKSIFDWIKDFIGTFSGENFRDLIVKITSTISYIALLVESFLTLRTVRKGVADLGGMLTEFGKVASSLTGAIQSWGAVGQSLSYTIAAVGNKISGKDEKAALTFWDKLKIIADVIVKIAAAIAVLALLPKEAVLLGTGSIIVVLAAMGLIIGAAGHIDKEKGAADSFSALAKIFNSLVKLVLAVGMAMAIILVLAKDTGSIIAAGAVLTGILAMTVAMVVVLSKIKISKFKDDVLARLSVLFVAITKAMRSIALSIKIIAILSSPGQIIAAAAALAIVMAAMMGVIALITMYLEKHRVDAAMKKVKVIDAIVNVMKKLANLLIKVAVAILIVSFVKPEKLFPSVLAISAVMALLVGFILGIMLLAKKDLNYEVLSKLMTSIGVCILLMSLAMGRIAVVIKKLGKMKEDEFKRGAIAAGAIAVAMIAFVAIIGLISKYSNAEGLKNAGILIALLAAGLLIFIVALKRVCKIIESFDIKTVLSAMGIMVLGMGALGVGLLAMMVVCKAYEKMDIKPKMMAEVGVTLLAMAVVVSILGIAIRSFAKIKWEDLGKAAVVLAGAIVVLGLLMGAAAIMDKTGISIKPLLQLASVFAILAASVLALGIGLMFLARGVEKLAGNINALHEFAIGCMQILIDLTPMVFEWLRVLLKGVISIFTEGIDDIIDLLITGVVGLVEALIRLAPTFAQLVATIIEKFFPIILNFLPKIIDFLIDVLIVVIDGVTARIGDILASIHRFIVAFKEAFKVEFGIDNPGEIFATLALALLEFGAFVAILAIIGQMPITVALKGILIVAMVIAAVAILAVAFGELNRIPGFLEIIEDGAAVMGAIGNALGSLMGGIAAGFSNVIADTLPYLATKLSEFMTNLQPFIAGLKSIDLQVLAAVGILALVILALTAATVISQLASFLTGGANYTQFGKAMLELAPYIVAFGLILRALTNEDVLKAAICAQMVSVIANSLPSSGGLKDIIMGSSDATEFAKQLPILGAGIMAFALTVKSLQLEDVMKAVIAANAVSALANGLPNSGGVVSWFTGDNRLDDFGIQMKYLGDGIATFADKVKDIDEESFMVGVECAKAIVEVAKTIPNSGGVAGFFAGNNDMDDFGNMMDDFGNGIYKFYGHVSKITDSKGIGPAIDIAKSLVEVANSIPNSGGVAGFFAGNNDLDDFGNKMDQFGKGVANFYKNVKDISDTTGLKAAVEIATEIIKISESIPYSGGVLQFFTGEQDLGSFAANIAAFGTGINDFFINATKNDLDDSRITTLMSGVTSMVDAITKLKSIEFESSLLNALTGNLSGFGEAFKTYVSKINEINYTNVAAKTDYIVSNTNKLIDVFNNMGTFSIGADTLTTTLGDIADAADRYYNSIMTITDNKTLDYLMDKVKEQGEDIGTNFVAKIEYGMTTAITSTVATIKTDVVTPIKDAFNPIQNGVNQYETIGAEIINGLLAGMQSNDWTVFQAVNNMSDAIAIAFRNRLGIASPSKVAYEIGSYWDQGLVNGLWSNRGQIIDLIHSMANDFVNLKAVVTSSVSDIDSDYTNLSSPRITPVVDASSADKGFKDIKAISSRGLTYSITSSISEHQKKMQDDIGNVKVETQNDDVVEAVQGLKGEIIDLKAAWSKMKVVLDSDQLVGGITPGMNRSLGQETVYTERRM